MPEVLMKCKRCRGTSSLVVRTKIQLDAHLRKGRRCRQPFGPLGETCRGELEIVEPEQWKGD